MEEAWMPAGCSERSQQHVKALGNAATRARDKLASTEAKV